MVQIFEPDTLSAMVATMVNPEQGANWENMLKRPTRYGGFGGVYGTGGTYRFVIAV